MSDDNVIKFGRAKKALARASKEKRAAENRVKFGRTKAEKNRDRIKDRKLQKHRESDKPGLLQNL